MRTVPRSHKQRRPPVGRQSGEPYWLQHLAGPLVFVEWDAAIGLIALSRAGSKDPCHDCDEGYEGGPIDSICIHEVGELAHVILQAGCCCASAQVLSSRSRIRYRGRSLRCARAASGSSYRIRQQWTAPATPMGGPSRPHRGVKRKCPAHARCHLSRSLFRSATHTRHRSTVCAIAHCARRRSVRLCAERSTKERRR